MSDISRAALFGKLHPTAYQAIEGAFVFCKLRGNPYVELEHWLAQLLNAQDSDLHRILRHFGLDTGRLASDLTTALDRLPRGATTISDIAESVPDAVERAWVYTTLKFGAAQIRTGHLLFGLLKTERLFQRLQKISRQFDRVDANVLGRDFA